MTGFLKHVMILFITVVLIVCAGCGAAKGYQELSMNEAERWMADAQDDYLLVDVRTTEEYESGHIPGAILVPIEDIREGKVDALPELEQTLLLYCRTGRRAEDSGKLLADLGYKNIYVIGGIFDWTGEIVTGAEESGS